MLLRAFKICLRETVLVVLAPFGLYEQSSIVGICEHGSSVAFQEMCTEALELILCAFENLQNATLSFVLSAWNKWPSAGRIFVKFWASGLTKICPEKLFWFKIGLQEKALHEDLRTFTSIVVTDGKMIFLSSNVTIVHAIGALSWCSGCCCHLGEQT